MKVLMNVFYILEAVVGTEDRMGSVPCGPVMFMHRSGWTVR
jgi:hypothetical protein